MTTVFDDLFWRAFWSGPPAAGLFAVLGALIAFSGAAAAAAVSRRGARRQEWWDRAEWALNLAKSDRGVDRLTGFRALEGLRAGATKPELALIVAVTDAVAGETVNSKTDEVVDSADQPAQNGRRRLWPWQRRRGG